jgi:AraC-like DNA-binding protein
MYKEFSPPESLGSIVECFWSLRSAGVLVRPTMHRILPDGCTDIVFNFGEPPTGTGAAAHDFRSYVVGTMRTAFVVTLAGRVDVFGVRFRPGGSTPITSVPAVELAGRIVGLADTVPGMTGLADQLVGHDPVIRSRFLAGALSRRREQTARTLDPRVRHAVAAVDRLGGRLSVERLSEEVNLSRRQFERLYSCEVGVPPKEACRVARFRAAVRLMDAHPDLSLSGVAVSAGYYDQSHFHRDFRRFAALSPAAYRRERNVASVQDISSPIPHR